VWIDIEQNTDEWLDLRAGKVTGSAIAKIMANYGKAFGNPAKDLAANIAVERLTGKRCSLSHYTNAHMDRGHEEEPVARALYEQQQFVEVGNGGFYDHKKTGSSPDGLVYTDGVIEIKSAIVSVHYARIKRGTFDPTYKWQLFFNLKEADRDWIDFISYCSSFPIEKRLFVVRINQCDYSKEFDMIDTRLKQFELLVSEITDLIK